MTDGHLPEQEYAQDDAVEVDVAQAVPEAEPAAPAEGEATNGAAPATAGAAPAAPEATDSETASPATAQADEPDDIAVKAQAYLELAQRTQADFENYRKRAAREAALAQERGIGKLAKELLPAIDNLERAVQAAEAAHDPLINGVKLVQAEILSALARVGIEPFSPVGEPFNPQHHEAVAQAPVEGATPGIVIEVYQQGFQFGETVLRPARVLVAA